MIYDYIIIGAGASGVLACINLIRNGKKVLLIEKTDRILKKILVTGNGRCNFTNINASPKNYYSQKSGFVDYLFTKYPPEKIIQFFNDLGLEAIEENFGKMYPRSFQASSVVDVLRFELEKLNAEILLNYDIKNISYGNLFHIDEYTSKNVIIAVGGNSYNSFNGYDIARKFGHRITKLTPILVQLKCDKQYIQGLEGIKQEVNLTAYNKGKIVRKEAGELLFTTYGISGSAVFNISPVIAKYGFDIEFKIDFLPEISEDKLIEMLFERRDKLSYLKISDFLVGFLHKKFSMFLLKKSGIDKLLGNVSDISDETIFILASNIKRYSVISFDTMGFKNSQVTAGGVDTNQINPKTYESKLVKNLYFCGEVLDVYGDCGGYNLQFAFASGLLVGERNDKD